MDKNLSWDDFTKVDMRVGTVVEVRDFPKALRPAYQLELDFGNDIGVLKTSAQVTKRYQKEDLLGMQLIAVVNFPKKQIANFMSECLIIGVVGEDNDVSLLSPSLKTKNGLRVG
ncbi:tRNA-binding protein [Galbibacter marinus]|uniref:tRNA-binding protein n=1 Tax=Galbibacter marinus TaxID=555500 RepID=K2Q079_9FLAO|nr:tRNA-binding protein [Galbibacter marinus]EKF54256.1 tRNA-binding protein [Galbibacter marinus]